MVVIAESFLQMLEVIAINEALFNQQTVNPIILKRFVDDSHARFEIIEDAEKFLTILNAQHQNISYTMEKEDSNKMLQFLDVKVINSGTGVYEYDVYRKGAITNVQVKPESSHDPSILRGIFKGFLHQQYQYVVRDT